MSYTSIILQTMRANQTYTPEDLHAETRINAPGMDVFVARQLCKMLEENGLIEKVGEKKYKKKKRAVYKTKQLPLI